MMIIMTPVLRDVFFGVLRQLPANCAAVSGNLVAAFWLHLSTETWFHLTLKLVVEMGEQTTVLWRAIILTYGFVDKFHSEFCDSCIGLSLCELDVSCKFKLYIKMI